MVPDESELKMAGKVTGDLSELKFAASLNTLHKCKPDVLGKLACSIL
jgi:hypothetical protein